LTSTVIKIIIFFLFSTIILSKEKWVHFNLDNSPLPNRCYGIIQDKEYNLWFCTELGIIKKSDNEWMIFDSNTAGIQNTVYTCAAQDGDGNYWFGTKDGLIYKYDREKWLSWQLNGFLHDIEIDKNIIWAAGWECLARFKDNEWELYNLHEIFPNIGSNIRIWDMIIDGNGVKWILNAGSGLFKYNDSVFTFVNNESLIFPSYFAVDSKKNLFLATHSNLLMKHKNEDLFDSMINIPDSCGGLKIINFDKDEKLWMGFWPNKVSFASYYNDTLKYYSHDSITNFSISEILIDEYNNKWLPTENLGVFVFNENGVILDDIDDKSKKDSFIIFPNPFSEKTRISFNLEFPSFTKITVFNSLGYGVAVLSDEYLSEGRHEFTFDGTSLPSGTYYFVLQANGKVETGKLVLIK